MITFRLTLTIELYTYLVKLAHLNFLIRIFNNKLFITIKMNFYSFALQSSNDARQLNDFSQKVYNDGVPKDRVPINNFVSSPKKIKVMQKHN